MEVTKEQILKAVTESGFLMEQEVASTLENLKFHVSTNVAFEDSEEGKSRETDVFAFKRFYFNESSKIIIDIIFLCECKNNTNPFVFISRKKNATDRNFIPNGIVLAKDELHIPIESRPNTFSIQKAFKVLQLNDYHHYFKTEQKAVQFCKIIRQGKDFKAQHDGIYDGIFIPLAKAFEAKRKEVQNNTYSHNVISLIYPMVILNSEIYDIDSDSPKPEEKQYISFKREIKSKQLKGQFLIEFINKRAIEEFYQNEVLPFANRLLEIAENNPEKLTNKPV
jgi:hypothetical protein